MLKRSIAAVTVVSMMIIAVIITTTTPSTSGPVGVLAFFIFLYLAALGVLTFIFYGVSAATPKMPLLSKKRVNKERLSLKRSYYYASVVALVPVMLIALKTVNEIGIYQILLISVFTVVAWIYVTNRTT